MDTMHILPVVYELLALMPVMYREYQRKRY